MLVPYNITVFSPAPHFFLTLAKPCSVHYCLIERQRRSTREVSRVHQSPYSTYYPPTISSQPYPSRPSYGSPQGPSTSGNPHVFPIPFRNGLAASAYMMSRYGSTVGRLSAQSLNPCPLAIWARTTDHLPHFEDKWP